MNQEDNPENKNRTLFATKSTEDMPVLKESEPGSTLRPLPIAGCDGTPAVLTGGSPASSDPSNRSGSEGSEPGSAGVPPASDDSDSDPEIEFEASLPSKPPKIIFGLLVAGFLSVVASLAGPILQNITKYSNALDLRFDWASALALLPFQVYLMVRFYQLSKAVGARFKKKPPFSGQFTFLISIVSMSITPSIWFFTPWAIALGANEALISGFTYAWMILQLILPLGILRYMRRNAEESSNYIAEVALLSCAALELYLNPGSSSGPSLCGCWYLTQIATIKYAWSKVLGRVRTASKQKILSAGDDTVIEYHPFAAITRWRKQQEGALNKDLKVILCFAIPMLAVCFLLCVGFLSQVERQAEAQRFAQIWEKQQAVDANELEEYRIKLTKLIKEHAKQLPKLPDCVAYFSIYPGGGIINELRVSPETYQPQIQQVIRSIDSLVAAPNSSSYFADNYNVFQVQASFASSGAIEVEVSGGALAQTRVGKLQDFAKSSQEKVNKKEVESQFSKSFLDYLQFGSITLLLSSVIFVAAKPTHLGFSPKGWRFLWRRRFHFRNDDYQSWSDIERIYMDKPEKSTSPLDEELCFKLRNGDVRKLKMGSMESVEDRELLLKGIEKWAPSVARDASVIQALQAPADHSYTELWLQALSAAPKRERLKPLVKGTELKKGIYKVVDQIGAGGQGHAYLAKNDQGESVVLKECILPVYVDVSVRRSSLEVFENEARLLRQIDHPQIVKLIDFFVEDHRSYLVLEHIDGMSLRQIVKTKGALSEKQVRDLSQQMCEILKCLHGLNPPVVHRDFTPDNLILHRDGTLKLIDFNVAKQVVESTTSGTVVGKHAYLPPEQFRGMPECASDIYAMGATIHFLLSGADPEPISTSHPKRLVTTISDSINAIVERATALDLKKRYNSIQDLLSDLNTDT